MSNEIVEVPELPVIEGSIACVLPQATELLSVHNAINIKAEQNYAIQQLYRNKRATDIAIKNPVSVSNAILNLAAIGISLNPATKHAYLVPRDDMICLDISYMGLMHLAQQIGSIEWGQAKVVFEHDSYESRGLGVAPLHRYNAFKDRGKRVGVFCCVKLPSGDYLTEEMDEQEVMAVKNSSKSKNSEFSPWKRFEGEMWRKSVVKRGSKYWPKSNNNRFDRAIHVLNEHEGLEVQEEEIYTPSAEAISLNETSEEIAEYCSVQTKAAARIGEEPPYIAAMDRISEKVKTRCKASNISAGKFLKRIEQLKSDRVNGVANAVK